MKNIISVDLEDYYCDLPISRWVDFEPRIEKSTLFLLDSFKKYNIQATFFVVGAIAEKFPSLVEKIVSDGHEISSHSYSHSDLRKLSKQDFELDVDKSVKTLHHFSKEKVLGFRAPLFSIEKRNIWTIQILKNFFSYDSSLFPVRTPLYGVPNGQRFPYHMSESDPFEIDDSQNFLEIPPSTLNLPLYGNLPIAGGFYLRLFPSFLIKYSINKLNKQKIPAMLYIHPKDFDDNWPKIPEYSWHYYWNRGTTKQKFESLLKSFTFTSVREIFF